MFLCFLTLKYHFGPQKFEKIYLYFFKAVHSLLISCMTSRARNTRATPSDTITIGNKNLAGNCPAVKGPMAPPRNRKIDFQKSSEMWNLIHCKTEEFLGKLKLCKGCEIQIADCCSNNRNFTKVLKLWRILFKSSSKFFCL